jgi:hypothetical protein
MRQTPLSLPGLTGRPSIPETFEINREAAAYWIARSSRAMTVLLVATYHHRHGERSEAIHSHQAKKEWIASRSLSSGGALRRPVGSQ